MTGADLFRPRQAHPAARLLSSLGHSRFTAQLFDDDEDRQAKDRRAIRHGTFPELQGFLEGMNRKRAGVFFMVNPGDFQGRSAANVTGVGSYLADLDGTPLMDYYPLEPTAVVESSPGKYHLYWKVSGAPLDADLFRHFQHAIADLLISDPVVNDLCRVMRLPGFLHQKSDPWRVTLISAKPELVYTHADFQYAFGIPDPVVIPPLPRAAQTYLKGMGDSPRTANRQVLYDRVAMTGKGGRNHTLFKNAAALANDVASGELDVQEYREQLLYAGQVAGLSIPEIEKTITSALRYPGQN